MTLLTTSIIQRTMLCLEKVIPPLQEDCSQSIHSLQDSIIKVGSGIRYSEKLLAFVDSIPEVRQQKCKKFVDRRLFRYQKNVSDTITKNNFVAPAK